jgi:predicted glycosyltransferase
MKPALLFYCQHSMGLGHLVRSWAIADALSSAFHVVLVSGGEPPTGMRPPANIDVVTLPALEQTTAGTIVTRQAGWTVADVQASRARLLLDAFSVSQPAVVLIELFPFGRAKFTNEILPMLERAAAARHRPLVVCSLRDLLAGGRRNQQQHDYRAQQIAEAYFDAVLVHADPRLATLEETFKPRTALHVPVVYTGFVTPRPSAATVSTTNRSGILVSAGGGRVGGPLFRAAVEAHALCPPDRVPMHIVTGPFLPGDQYDALRSQAMRHANLTIDRSVPALGPLLRSAALSISQCGYNTALDLLQARVPALVVPFAEGREDEQRARAGRLQALGALRVLDSDVLTGSRLAIEIAATRGFVPAPIALDLDGADETLRVITRLWESRESGVAPLPGRLPEAQTRAWHP